VVEANGPTVEPNKVAAVPPGEMFVQTELSGDDCHWIVPVFPASVMFAGWLAGQMVCVPEAVPATVAGLTFTTTLAVFTGAHEPLVTTAR